MSQEVDVNGVPVEPDEPRGASSGGAEVPGGDRWSSIGEFLRGMPTPRRVRVKPARVRGDRG